MIKWVGRGIGILLMAGAIVFFGILPPIVEKGRNQLVEHAPYVISPTAQTLHDSLIIGDLHADSLMWNRNLLKRGTRGHVDLPRLQEGNVGFQVFTTVTKSPAGLNIEHNHAGARDNITLLAIAEAWPIKSWFNLTERGLYMAKRLQALEDKSQGTLKFIKTKSDLEQVLQARAAGENVTGAFLGSEGGHILEGDIANLDRIYDAGFRLIGLTHFFDNALGGSLHGYTDAGLSDFGRDVVRAMVDKNMAIDLAHTSEKMAREVIAMTDVPLMVSHTGIYSNCQVKRNFPDDLMRDIVATGGVIGIGYWGTVTCDASPAGIARTIKAAIDVVGIDHVALGSDFDGAVKTQLDVSELAVITQNLLDIGLTEQQIKAVMGENMVRFWMAVLGD